MHVLQALLEANQLVSVTYGMADDDENRRRDSDGGRQMSSRQLSSRQLQLQRLSGTLKHALPSRLSGVGAKLPSVPSGRPSSGPETGAGLANGQVALVSIVNSYVVSADARKKHLLVRAVIGLFFMEHCKEMMMALQWPPRRTRERWSAAFHRRSRGCRAVST